MKREEMIKFLRHVAAREASHGVADAFRFKAVLSSRKKGSLQNSKYIDHTRDAAPSPAPSLPRDLDDPTPASFNATSAPSRVTPAPDTLIGLVPAWSFDTSSRSQEHTPAWPSTTAWSFGNNPAPSRTDDLGLYTTPDPNQALPFGNNPAPSRTDDGGLYTTPEPDQARPFGNNPAPSRTDDLGLYTTPEPDQAPDWSPVPASRPKPRPLVKTHPHPISSTILSLDPRYYRDPPIMLDKSLDPALQGPDPSNEWLTVPSTTFNFPPSLELDSNEHRPTQRQKGKSADRLAIEEAQKLAPKGKSRRR